MREATRDKDRLEHVLEAIDNVETYIEGISEETAIQKFFLNDISELTGLGKEDLIGI